MTTAIDDFNETIHPPRRLFICSFLASVDEAEFGTLRDAAGISDSSLSKHLSALAGAGYVRILKPTGRGRVRTWVALTSEGREAFASHRRALQLVLGAISL
ncbi:transcriptional regulator [Paeniglutamicibacter antarcticus]|uniref:Transcriptional regulator n=1 Tax=Arthrobacter terrae TaxID=2935737 RepID=A0A931G7J1_9MICC|nr:transcriptional regulator [Arthrobacter terrae]MBG0741805.1 transcriptional regulator [Arthrobacter terrae]